MQVRVIAQRKKCSIVAAVYSSFHSELLVSLDLLQEASKAEINVSCSERMGSGLVDHRWNLHRCVVAEVLDGTVV